MSEVETNATPATLAVVPAPASAPAAPAKPLTAIQHIEEEIVNFIKQREIAAKNAEKAIANVHAIDGAIQAANFLVAKLKNEAAKAEAEAKKLYGAVKTEVEKLIGEVKPDAAAVEADVKKDAVVAVADVEAAAKKL